MSTEKLKHWPRFQSQDDGDVLHTWYWITTDDEYKEVCALIHESMSNSKFDIVQPKFDYPFWVKFNFRQDVFGRWVSSEFIFYEQMKNFLYLYDPYPEGNFTIERENHLIKGGVGWRL